MPRRKSCEAHSPSPASSIWLYPMPALLSMILPPNRAMQSRSPTSAAWTSTNTTHSHLCESPCHIILQADKVNGMDARVRMVNRISRDGMPVTEEIKDCFPSDNSVENIHSCQPVCGITVPGQQKLVCPTRDEARK
jgi:hypothetical protein